MSVTSVLIDKHGKCTTKQLRDVNEENLYKKCGFSTNDNFGLIQTFKCKDNYVHLFGKTHGRANTVNKFELPPPVDTTLYYGSILILATEKKVLNIADVLNYTKEKWRIDYEFLMGGFEDIENTDNESESDEMDEYSDSEKTKNGYLKDGFVVDEESTSNGGDDSGSESEYEDSELEEEYYDEEDDNE
jgi:hypothetical protein